MVRRMNEAMKAFEERLENAGRSEQTRIAYIRDVERFRRFLIEERNSEPSLAFITEEDIERYLAYCLKVRHITPQSRNRYLTAIMRFFAFCVKKKWLEKNPAEDIDQIRTHRKPRHALTASEFERLFEHIRHLDAKVALMFMLTTGVRVSEALSIRLQDVDFEREQVIVTGKGNKQRVIPLSKGNVEMLADYLDNIRDADSEKLFALKKTGSFSSVYLNRLLNEAREKAGIERHVTNHILRHTFATHLLKEGVDISVLQKLMGHNSLRTTAVYLHHRDEDLRAAMGKMNMPIRRDGDE